MPTHQKVSIMCVGDVYMARNTGKMITKPFTISPRAWAFIQWYQREEGLANPSDSLRSMLLPLMEKAKNGKLLGESSVFAWTPEGGGTREPGHQGPRLGGGWGSKKKQPKQEDIGGTCNRCVPIVDWLEHGGVGGTKFGVSLDGVKRPESSEWIMNGAPDPNVPHSGELIEWDPEEKEYFRRPIPPGYEIAWAKENEGFRLTPIAED